jgi:transglutaminase-like putative cysteine protease
MTYRFMSVWLLMIVTPGGVQAQKSPAPKSLPGVVTSHAVVYRVKMTTIFVVPAGNSAIDELRVWHALPVRRPWSKVTGDVGASEIKFSAAGSQQYEKEHDSHHIFWRHARPLKPGTRFTFTSEFSVRSVDRTFQPGKIRVRWKDYDRPQKDPSAKADAELAKKVHPTIAQVADRLKKSALPPVALALFCQWMKDTIKYDASVPYPPSDMAAIMQNRKGHCGHGAAVLAQFCARTGIPMRGVAGLNLYSPNGRGELSPIRADWTNIHTWAEVYFPGIGWVEVDGGWGYTVPAYWIQNNKWFQNYAIWIREKGTNKVPTWTYKDGKFTSDYGVEHLITYSAVAEKVPRGR